MNLMKILTAVLLAGSIFLLYYLYDGIESVVAEREEITNKEAQMKARLLLIREAEIVFQAQTGHYTANWDSLADFIEKGEVPIIQITEKIEQQAYGVEKVTQIRDTLGFIPAKEKIFKKNFTMNAADDGIFQSFNVKVGDRVIKNQKAYSIIIGGEVRPPVFIENGIIASLADLKPGDKVSKGQNMINFWDYQFNPNIDVSKIGEVPYMPGKMINIFVGKIDKSGLKVDVIEVTDPAPADKTRKESNENKSRKPLRFGSRLDASTTGNWE
jgi:hypothetical protein